MPRKRATRTPTLDIRNRVKELRYVRPSDLADHPLQWRIHGELQSQAMQGLLRDVGIAGALLAYDSPTTGLTSIDGHLRKSLADTLWPTLILDVTDEEARLLLASYDPISAMAETNRTQLAALLADVTSGDAGVQALLQQLAEAQGLAALTDAAPLQDVEPEVDRAEELRAQYGVEVGSLWACGAHRVVCGDCTDKRIIERVMEGEQTYGLLTDPPYGMHLDTAYAFSKGNAEKGIKPTKGYAPVIGDDQAYDASWLFVMFRHAAEVFLFGADYYVDTLPAYGKHGAWMVWDKKNEQLRNVLGLADFELIWSRQRHKRRVYAYLWNGALGTESEDTHARVHPTQKPVRLLTAIIDEYLETCVVDPYLGSGTTLIACEQLGRVCRGVELAPAYVAVCLERWHKLSGELPKRIA